MSMEMWAMMAGAFILGMAFSRGLLALWPQRKGLRIAFLILFPLIVLGSAPIIYFGWPVGEDWVWLTIVYAVIYPLGIAWYVGVLVEMAIRKLRAGSA